MERIIICKIGEIHLKEKLAKDFNILSGDIPDEFLEFMEKVVKMRNSPDEYIQTRMEIPQSLPNTLQFLIPRIYYHINIKKATWTMFGLILDLLLTKGVALTALALLGVTGQAIGKIEIENGEICNYYQVCALKHKEFKEEDIFNRISDRDCPYPDFECVYKRNDKCSIKISGLKRNFDRLREIGAISKTKSNKWRVEL